MTIYFLLFIIYLFKLVLSCVHIHTNRNCHACVFGAMKISLLNGSVGFGNDFTFLCSNHKIYIKYHVKYFIFKIIWLN